MENTKVFFAKGDSPAMIAAFGKAQESFKFFWRELSWEYRRIVPALGFACVKVAFLQKVAGKEEPIVEHMWINQINFDGEKIYGVLINDPYELTNIKKGDEVAVPVHQISDWLFALQGKTYGGFTIQTMRAEMSDQERAKHDTAWGLDFGDYQEVLVAYEQKEQPENLIEHPMSRNMKERLLQFLQENPNELTATDELGQTLLHRETIAGNRSSVEILLQEGVDLNALTKSGKTALDFAKSLQWTHLIPLLEQ